MASRRTGLIWWIYTPRGLFCDAKEIPQYIRFGGSVAIAVHSTFHSTYRELCGHSADLTFHITDQCDVQAGLRGGHINPKPRNHVDSPVHGMVRPYRCIGLER